MKDDLAVERRTFLRYVGGATALTGTSGVASSAPLAGQHTSGGGLSLSFLGRYSAGVYDEGAAEIPAYDGGSQRAFVVNGDAGGIDVLDVSTPSNPTRETTLDVGRDGPNNVAINDGTVAAAVEAEDVGANGEVAFFDAETLERLGRVEAGPLPDMVTFADGGDYVVTANEGEPNDDYSTDPRGSVSVVDISEGIEDAAAETAGFKRYDGQEESLRQRGIRVYGPGSTASMDFEPEYVATAGTTAYVTLQENNALAVVDIESAEVTELKALGYKDFSKPGNGLDAVEDGEIDIKNQPLFGMYQPDAISAYDHDGETYLVTTNEGDAREYDALFETGVLKRVDGQWGLDSTEDDGDNIDVPIDDTEFDPGVLDELSGLEATTQYGDVDDDGTIEELYLFGARSIAVHDSDGNRIAETGETLEQVVADRQPEWFNTDDDENGMDEESVASGPEPEGITTGLVGGKPYAFVGLEEVSAITTFDISTPDDPEVVDYINTRNFEVGPEDDIEEGSMSADAAGDLSPEGVVFVPQTESPIGDPMVIVSYEVSGTTSLYRVSVDAPTPEGAVPGGQAAPADMNGDGRFEDIDGDGDADAEDVKTLLNERDSDVVRANEDAFDHDGSGDVSIGDVASLYRKIFR